MQTILLQLSRGGMLLVLWLFVWLILRALKADVDNSRGMAGSAGLPYRPARRARSRGAFRVNVVEGALAGMHITLGEQPILIGRADDSTLVLDDDYVSHRHARLTPHEGNWLVEDLGSTNGTFINSQRVSSPVQAEPGVPIRIGQTVIELSE